MSCSVSSQKDYRPRPSPSSRPRNGLDGAKVQGQRTTTSVSSLEQDDAAWAKSLLEQWPERVELELRRSAAIQERQSSMFKMLLSGRKRFMRINSTSTRG